MHGTYADYTLCRMERAQLAGAAELERLCFSEPWSEGALELYLADGVAVAALSHTGQVLAYGGFLPAPAECEILRVAVHPQHRRQGLGGAVLDALLREAASGGAVRAVLEVRVSNAPAVALYRSRGFTVAGVRRRFYRHPVEDAYTMIRERAEDLCTF